MGALIPIRDENPTHHFAWMTVLLIVANIVVFFGVQERDGGREEIEFTFQYAAIPCEITEGRPLDLPEIRDALNGSADTCNDTAEPAFFADKIVWLAGFTSMFLHADLFHLGFNMLFLWVFGNNIEDHFGPIKYLVFYALSGVAALAAHIGLQPNSAIPVIGASGAVAGVMGAYLVWFPRAPVRTLVFLFFIFVPRIPAFALLTIWFVTQFFTGADSSVAWAAHVGGFVFGAAVAALVRLIPGLCNLLWRPPHTGRHRGDPWDPTGGAGPNPPRARYAPGTTPLPDGRPW